ncbi:hypothetical protein L7F22_004783 [Adiantum nelumboides]|nr:hypothetical protein [Adiantum nelumboides]
MLISKGTETCRKHQRAVKYFNQQVVWCRSPKGVKKTHYYRCTHELYSFYGDFVRWDGLIERIILYEDDEKTNVVEIHDYFQRRKDGLRKRIFIPGANKVHDFFDPGASFGLKETEIIEGHSRKFLFYADTRTDGLNTRDEVDPFTSEQSQFDKLDEFNSLIMAEREAIKSVRDTEQEIEETLQQRLREEQNVVLITPYIDIACVKEEDLSQEGEDAIKLPTDYLSAFLPPGVRPRQKLSRQQMLDVRDSCLKAVKERLVNRATIIQTRYDEETSALSKRRANFERDREQMTVEDEETYNLDCDNALFRIRILEFRAKQHEDEALKK